MTSSTQKALPRSLNLGIALIAIIWIAAAHTASHIASRVAEHSGALYPLRLLLGALTFGLFIACGFAVIRWIAARDGRLRDVILLPERVTAGREAAIGCIVGWAVLLAAVLPAILAGDITPSFWFAPRAFGLAIIALLALAAGSLAHEMAFRGFVLAHLSRATGPVTAALFISLLYGIVALATTGGSIASFVLAFVASLVLSMTYLRTHALWLSWALHFAFSAACAVVLGLPLHGMLDYASVVTSATHGSLALTGGDLGPSAALTTALAFIAALPVVYALTRDFAWSYTHAEIIPAAYAVVVQPPAAHTAMEQQAAAATPLVQILSTAPTAPSTMPEVNAHLRNDT